MQAICQDMYEDFKLNYERYKKDHIPKAKEITKKVDVLLNAMRADLPDNWEMILANNSLFLGVEFTVTLHDMNDKKIRQA